MPARRFRYEVYLEYSDPYGPRLSWPATCARGSECPAQQAPSPPLAPANHFLGIMSALTLLSIIAPAVPSAPKGSSGEAATGFQSLLAALSGEEAIAPEGDAVADDTTTAADVGASTPSVTGFLVAPAPPPLPQTLPPAEGSSSDSDAHVPSNGGGKADAGPTTLPPVPDGAAEPPADPHTLPFAPVDKGPAPKTSEPQVLPAVADGRLLIDPSDDIPVNLARAAAVAEAVAAEARTTAAPQPSVPPPAVPAPIPVPAPLRLLAERTSRPLEAPVGQAADGAGISGPAPSAPVTAIASAPVPASQPAGSPDLAAAAAAAAAGHDDSGDGEAETSTPDQPVPLEGGPVTTQGSGTARETVASQLSRSTVEATAQIAAQILRRLEGRSTRFEMALTPDELGRVDVKLDIDAEGRLNARLAFDNPAAATDLRGRADELRRQLEDAGFHLAEDAFQFAERDSGSSAFDRGQDARNGSSRAFAAATRLNNEIDVAQPPRWMALSLSPSGLDMKV